MVLRMPVGTIVPITIFVITARNLLEFVASRLFLILAFVHGVMG